MDVDASRLGRAYLPLMSGRSRTLTIPLGQPDARPNKQRRYIKRFTASSFSSGQYCWPYGCNCTPRAEVNALACAPYLGVSVSCSFPSSMVGRSHLHDCLFRRPSSSIACDRELNDHLNQTKGRSSKWYSPRPVARCPVRCSSVSLHHHSQQSQLLTGASQY